MFHDSEVSPTVVIPHEFIHFASAPLHHYSPSRLTTSRTEPSKPVEAITWCPNPRGTTDLKAMDSAIPGQIAQRPTSHDILPTRPLSHPDDHLVGLNPLQDTIQSPRQQYMHDLARF